MKKLILLTIFLSFLLLLSCATSKFIQTGSIYPAYIGPVKVFFAMPPDSIHYEEIGIISSQGGTIHEWTHLIEAMQKKAALKGANAIIILDKDKDKIAFITYNQQYGLLGGTGSYKSMMCIAIKIKD